MSVAIEVDWTEHAAEGNRCLLAVLASPRHRPLPPRVANGLLTASN